MKQKGDTSKMTLEEQPSANLFIPLLCGEVGLGFF